MSMTNVTLSVQLRYYRPRSVALSFIYADIDCSAGGRSIFLPLVIEEPEGPHYNTNSTPSDAITALRFDRRGGSRPILLSEVQGNYLGSIADDWCVPESGTISILKKDSVHSFALEIYLGGLKDPATQSIIAEVSSQDATDILPLQVVLDEVYPPHCSGKNARFLGTENLDRQSFRYPSSAEGTSDYGHHGYGNVSYLRISCWDSNSKRSEMIVIVRDLETNDFGSSDSETDMEVRLSE